MKEERERDGKIDGREREIQRRREDKVKGTRKRIRNKE